MSLALKRRRMLISMLLTDLGEKGALPVLSLLFDLVQVEQELFALELGCELLTVCIIVHRLKVEENPSLSTVSLSSNLLSYGVSLQITD